MIDTTDPGLWMVGFTLALWLFWGFLVLALGEFFEKVLGRGWDR